MRFGYTSPKEDKYRFTRRWFLLGAGQMAAFGLLVNRLYEIQAIDVERYKLQADDNRIRVRLQAPLRGRILDRTGRVMASNREDRRVLIIPALAENIAMALNAIDAIVPLTDKQRDAVLENIQTKNPQFPIAVADRLTWQQFSKINVLAPQMPGVTTSVGWRRHYNNSYYMAHITGYLGSASPLQLAEEPVTALPEFKVGKTGVEEAMDKKLRGQPGRIKMEVDASGHIIRELAHTFPEMGQDIALTVNSRLQGNITQLISRKQRAAVVGMDVRTGEIMAMASTPGYNSNYLTGEIDLKYWQRLLRNKNKPLVNKAIRGQYPPGSTFKMITALAALEAGVIGPWDLVHCSGSFTYEGHTFACWNRYGHKNMNLYNAIKNSCDVYFYEVAIRTGIDRIAKMAQRFGLGQTYDCGIAGQKPGVVPNKAWKEMELGESWLGGETALAGIGQGYVLTTPLQLAVMTSRIATGRKVQPTLIKRKQPERFSSLGVNTGFLKHVRRGMYAVVNTNGGTAEDVAMNYKGVLLVGKTGTSQVRRNISRRKVEHMRWKDRPHALFVAYGSRKGRPNYAVAAIVEHGGSGAEEAAPLARDALLKILAYDPANYL